MSKNIMIKVEKGGSGWGTHFIYNVKGRKTKYYQ